MRLADLAAALPAVVSHSGDDVDVTGIVADSRQAGPGSLFVAIRGVAVDGHAFIPEAVTRGAVAVVGETPRDAAPGLQDAPAAFPYVEVAHSREALGWLCAAWHGFPSRALTLVGVTGTDGKTTTVHLIDSILRASGAPTGMISTVSARIGSEDSATGLHVTTPDAPEVQGILARMVADGATHAVLEATSQGLAQRRLSGCDFDVAVLTNITHEHIDAHGSFQAYREAKARLFRGLARSSRRPGIPKVAVVNRDDDSYHFFCAIEADRHLSYGLNRDADVQAHAIELREDGSTFTIGAAGGNVPIRTALVGKYNISNILAAAAAAIGLGVDPDAIRRGVADMGGVQGRMEHIDEGQDYLAIVDFAHTPNALDQALRAARSLVGDDGRLIVVFGSAGLRDPTKRALMGRVAGRLSDYVVITAEDPRTECLDEIMAECVAGALDAGKREDVDVWRIADRGQAILSACQMARGGDVVVVCGKGHEQSMCFGTIEYPWDDREALRLALRGRALGGLPTSDPSWSGKR